MVGLPGNSSLSSNWYKFCGEKFGNTEQSWHFPLCSKLRFCPSMLCSAEPNPYLLGQCKTKMLDCSKKISRVTGWGPSKGGPLNLCRCNGHEAGLASLYHRELDSAHFFQTSLPFWFRLGSVNCGYWWGGRDHLMAGRKKAFVSLSASGLRGSGISCGSSSCSSVTMVPTSYSNSSSSVNGFNNNSVFQCLQ